MEINMSLTSQGASAVGTVQLYMKNANTVKGRTPDKTGCTVIVQDLRLIVS